MSISQGNFGYGDPEIDLNAQMKAAQDRNLFPTDPVEFIKWVRETVRDNNTVFNKLREEHRKLVHAADLATIGLKRLESLILINQRPKLEYLISLHRDFVFKNQKIGRILDDCQGRLRETTTNYGMVAESLGDPLADRHKKIAIQKELGLRLKDLEDSKKRCILVVENQAKLNKQLSEGIQLFLSEVGVTLTPAVKENITREDAVRRIALDLRKTLDAGHDRVNFNPYNPASQKPQMIVEPREEVLEKEEKRAEKKAAIQKASMAGLGEPSDGVNFKVATAALAVGAIIGVLVFFRPIG
jgi:hypothetical protein